MPSGSTERDDILPVSALAQILWRRLWAIVLVTTLLTGVVVGANLMQQPQYQASIKVFVGQGDTTDEAVPLQPDALESLTQTMTQAVVTRPTAEATSKRLDQKVSPDDILGGLSAEQLPETQFIDVSYTNSNPKTAQRVVNAVGAAFAQQAAEMTSESSSVTATVYESATVPSTPISPTPLRNGFLAFLLGIMLGIGLAFVLEYFDSSWQSPEEAERISGVPTFGVIPEFRVAVGRKRLNVGKG